jgi:type VI secretion system secreted protein VgrG
MADPLPIQMKLVCDAAPSLLFKSMSALEEVSRLFELRVVAVSEDPAIGADAVLGQPAAVSIEVADGQLRWFHGIVAAFGIDGVEGRRYSYRLVLRPWLWLLTRSADLRIFQEMSAPDIVKQVFGEYASQFVDELTGSYGTRSYCVQYRETDFDFVSRLMEEEGIFYYFRHSEDKHELVLADAPGTHVPLQGYAEIGYFEDEGALGERQGINVWRMRHEIQTGKYTLADYNFETPSTSLLSATAESGRGHGENAHEVYDYPGLYAVKADGDARAKLRLDEASSRFTRYTGQGNTPGLAAGSRFALKGHPGEQDAEYVVLQTRIDAVQAGYEAGVGDETRFLCRFVAQSHADPFRPARITRKPTVAGPQTALVVGGGSEGDIETDEHGRVKVQFHWDRLGQKNADSSCWLRVASGWAGNGWGMLSLPRIGQEVVVAFLEGDPDQPLVIGRVHNAEQKTPYELPANASVSTIKSRSMGGGADEFNELRFEDKAGEEYVLLHAQKDRLEFVEETLKAEIGADEHRIVKGNRKEKIEGDLHHQVVGAVKQKVDGKWSLKVADETMIATDAKAHLKSAQDLRMEGGTKVSLKAGTELHVKAGQNTGLDSGMNVHIKGGMNVVIEAGMQLTIKVGGSSVVLGPDGVSITGPLVKVNSGGAAGSGSGASPDAPTAPEAPEDPEAPQDPLSHR